MGKLSCRLLIYYYLYVVLLYITMWFTIIGRWMRVENVQFRSTPRVTT